MLESSRKTKDYSSETRTERTAHFFIDIYIMETIEKSYPERRTYTVDDIARILNIGRTFAYILVKERHFKIVRIGNAIRISKKSVDAWLDSLEL